MARKPPPEPAWLDDPALTVSLREVRASIEFHLGTVQHRRVLLDEKEARVAKKSEDTRPQFAMREGSC